MKWIKCSEQKPTQSDMENNIYITLLFHIKDEWGRDHLVIGRYHEFEGYVETRTENGFNRVSVITITHPSEKYITPECMVGNHCSSAEIPIEQVIAWMHIPDKEQE